VDVVVKHPTGKPVASAVVYAVAQAGPPATPARVRRDVIDQIDREFVPHVKPVVVGTDVLFPNKDNIRHHVYSFSPAKTFELPLYKGTPAMPVRFDRPGVVVLGCNIHDWMLGYVVVLETPYFATTDTDGVARLTDLPVGDYVVRAWHPRAREPEDVLSRPVTVPSSGSVRAEFTMTLKPDFQPRRVPGRSGDRYR
jgi:plastocyanin